MAVSTGSAANTVAEDKDDISYGVEMEFVFAFHESKLQPMLETANGFQDKVRKIIPLGDRQSNKSLTRTNPRESPGRNYNSWGLSKSQPGGVERSLEGYNLEPMRIVQKVLAENCPELEVNVEGTMQIDHKTKDKYNKSIITVGHSICGVGSQNIPNWLSEYKIDAPAAQEWDSFGIEVVSRVYHTKSDPGDGEIRKIVEGVKGHQGDTYGAFTTNQCCLHVHVQEPKDLGVLQELAILLLIYEEEMGKIHPQCRRPWHDATRGNIYSNRIAAMYSDMYYTEVQTSTAKLKELITISQLRSEVTLNAKTKEEVARYMNAFDIMQLSSQLGPDYPYGDRTRLVNFTSIVRGKNSEGKEFPSTVEFCQAAGCLDADDIMRWVEFCIGLVRVAEFYYRNPGTFPVKTWQDSLSVFKLMKDMALSKEALEYWDSKYAYYQTVHPWDRECQTDNEVIPEELPQSDGDDSSHDDGGHGLGGEQLGGRISFLGLNEDDDEFGNSGNGNCKGRRVGVGGVGGVLTSGGNSSETEMRETAHDIENRPEEDYDDQLQSQLRLEQQEFEARNVLSAAKQKKSQQSQTVPKDVFDFDMRDWGVDERTPSEFENDFGNYSAGWAIRNSFAAQYPGPGGPGRFRSLTIRIDISHIIQCLNRITPPSEKPHSAQAVAKAVLELTSGSHNTVVVSNFVAGTLVSRYCATIAKMDLYLYLNPETQDSGTQGGWKAMWREVEQKPVILKGPPPTPQIVYLTGRYSTDIEQKTHIFLAPHVRKRIAQLKAQSKSRSRSPSPVPHSQMLFASSQQNGLSWRIINFDINDWKIRTSSIQHEGRKLSQVHALLQSMQQQYPDNECAKTPLPILLEIYYQITNFKNGSTDRTIAVPLQAILGKRVAAEARRELGKEKADLQALLGAWTDGSFVLAVVQQEAVSGMMSAWRAVPPNENGVVNNLFLQYTAASQTGEGGEKVGKWQAFERKTGTKL